MDKYSDTLNNKTNGRYINWKENETSSNDSEWSQRDGRRC